MALTKTATAKKATATKTKSAATKTATKSVAKAVADKGLIINAVSYTHLTLPTILRV